MNDNESLSKDQREQKFHFCKRKNDQKKQNPQSKEENSQIIPFLLEAEEDNEDLFTRIWNLREEITTLTQFEQTSPQELLAKSLELYQKDREERKFFIAQIKSNLLSKLGNK